MGWGAEDQVATVEGEAGWFPEPGQRMVSAALRLAKMQSRQDRQVWQE